MHSDPVAQECSGKDQTANRGVCAPSGSFINVPDLYLALL